MSTSSSSSAHVAWGFLGAVVVTACVTFPCGVGFGWFSRGVAAEKVEVNGKLVNNSSEWTFQDIQDHLDSKGWKTSRGEIDGGMFYRTGDGTPLDMIRTGLYDRGIRNGWLKGKEAFLAREFNSPDDAKREASRVKDVQQIDVFSWNRFSFQCSPETWGKLKTVLP